MKPSRQKNDSAETRLARQRPQPTTRARWLFRISLFLLFFSLMIQEPVLIQIGLFSLILMPLCYQVARLNLKNMDYNAFYPSEIFVKDTFQISGHLVSQKRFLDSFTINIHDRLTSDQFTMHHLRPGQGFQITLEGKVSQRGRIQRNRIELTSTFPFGLYETRTTVNIPTDIVVFPSPKDPRQMLSASNHAMHEIDRSQHHPDIEGEFRILREFRSGDRIRSIHWPASARTHQLLVREFDPPLQESYSFIFHSYAPHGQIMDGQSFELAMQLLCGFFLFCEEHGITFSFSASFNKWRPFHVMSKADLHRALVLLADAKQRIERDSDKLLERFLRAPQEDSCFIISNTPLKHWRSIADNIPFPVTCVDPKTWGRSTPKKSKKESA